ncbi:MAG TPA: hypothetical protein VJ789_12475 [Burkholderiales bacterium]|nr:hypothetical protein [Burkholderiales bacterium]
MLCVAGAGLAAGIERLLRKPEGELTSVDRTLAYLFVGRYFTRLRKRGYLLPARGWWALLSVLAAVALAALLAR